MEVKAENLAEFIKGTEAAMKVIDKYDQSRPSSMCFTKLEEAILWANVMVAQVNLRKEEEKPDENKVDSADAA